MKKIFSENFFEKMKRDIEIFLPMPIKKRIVIIAPPLSNSPPLITNHCLVIPDNGFHFQNFLGGAKDFFDFQRGGY